MMRRETISDLLPANEIIFSSGKPIDGEDRLEFRLLYSGPLRTNGGVDEKFSIRRQFHPQLKRLWREHTLLQKMCQRWGRTSNDQAEEESFTAGIEDLSTTINGFKILPLVRKEWHLRCSLDVLFLRREKPGNVFMKGDIDNRLKTLFDALRMPTSKQEIGSQKPRNDEYPFYTLLQEDDMVSDVSVTTDRLLTFPHVRSYESNYAVLVVNVKIQPIELTAWAHAFY